MVRLSTTVVRCSAVALLATALIVGVRPAPAEARGRGVGIAAGVAAGVLLGAMVAGAASARPSAPPRQRTVKRSASRKKGGEYGSNASATNNDIVPRERTRAVKSDDPFAGSGSSAQTVGGQP